MWEEFGEWMSKIKTHCTNLTELLYEQKQERGKYKRKKTDPVSHYLEEYGRRFSYFSMISQSTVIKADNLSKNAFNLGNHGSKGE